MQLLSQPSIPPGHPQQNTKLTSRPTLKHPNPPGSSILNPRRGSNVLHPRPKSKLPTLVIPPRIRLSVDGNGYVVVGPAREVCEFGGSGDAGRGREVPWEGLRERVRRRGREPELVYV
jgi:hypothetical protein